MRKLNYQRLHGWIEEVGGIGATPEGGVRRIAGTEADKHGRDKVVSWMRDIGLQVEIDRIGNIFGTLAGETGAAPIMIGSHIDTVGNGGKLDGPYGVLAGLEIAASFRDAKETPSRPLTVAIFTNEEGVRFQPDMMGSLVHAGGLDLETALTSHDRDGVTLAEALVNTGYAGEMACGAVTPHAFLELHIEQGPILEAEKKSIGVVEGVQGIFWTGFTISGQANHAGTTPMHLRRDAGFTASRIAVEARRIANEIEGQVATIGQIDLKPNLINVVAGSAYVTVDLRNADADRLQIAQNKLEAIVTDIAEAEGVTFTAEELVRFDPVAFDPAIVQTIEEITKESKLKYRRMTSGAGHDAQMMARICPTAMIFVPSINGVSHNPKEATAKEDLEAGLEVLSRTVDRLLQS
ncbi:Zn-dependent hydrolase [Hyphococcus flavus]|uniref:Zn-dependent hydrolase n=1 Tax=Hyphococcus flavus TaxID=1866326 RepID=A0AAE9ZCE6_9PROT|nr:Zn-dependent hydrolase [Hyphococcus flavus]WDI30875.1 Zn-dependent hydrolase [Hyphococcus flavus]